MRKLSNSFLTVGMILDFVCLGIFALCAVVFIILGTPVMENAWREAYQAGARAAGGGAEGEDAFVVAMSISFISGGICFLIAAAFCLPAAITAKSAKAKEDRNAYIPAIVFNALCGCGFAIAGAILGIIAKARQERNDRNNKIVDAQ